MQITDIMHVDGYINKQFLHILADYKLSNETDYTKYRNLVIHASCTLQHMYITGNYNTGGTCT